MLPLLFLLVAARPPALAVVCSGADDATVDDVRTLVSKAADAPVAERGDVVDEQVEGAKRLGVDCAFDDAACWTKLGIAGGFTRIVACKVDRKSIALRLVDVSLGKNLGKAEGKLSSLPATVVALLTSLPKPSPLIAAEPDDPPTPPMTTPTTTAPATTPDPPPTTTPTTAAAPPAAPGASALLAVGAVVASVGAVALASCGVGWIVAQEQVHADPSQQAVLQAPEVALATCTGIGAAAFFAGGIAAFAGLGP